jgi:hypothetical protein
VRTAAQLSGAHIAIQIRHISKKGSSAKFMGKPVWNFLLLPFGVS